MTRFMLPILLLSATGCGGDDNNPAPGDPQHGDPTSGDPGAGDPASGDAIGGDVGVNEVDWAILQHPDSHTGQPGTTLDVFGRVFEAGVTESAGQGAGIVGAVAVGAAGEPVTNWSTTAALFNVDAGNNDEYVATITLPSTPGTYRYAFRFQVDGGPWLLADLDASDNGFDLVETGTLVVEAPTAAVVDYCQLTNPATIQIGPSETSGGITAKVYEPGITDTGDPAGIVAQLGHGVEATDPGTWTWNDATFQTHAVNDDEYAAALVAPATTGVYDYAFRFRLAAETNWVLCDRDGSTNGFSADQAGKLTVAVPLVDWARVILPGESASVIPGQAVATEARVYDAGVSEGAGDGGLTVEFGVGDDGTDPASHGSWVFALGAYAGDLDGEGGSSNADDLFAGLIAAPTTIGSHDLAVRVRLAGEPWLFADAGGSNATDDLYDPAASRSISVVALPANGTVSWCRIQWLDGTSAPTDTVVTSPNAAVGLAYGRVLAIADPGAAQTTGATGTGPTPRSQIGVGDRGTDPVSHGSWNWAAGAFNVVDGDSNDEHTARLVAPAATGDYDWAWRFSMDDGATWLICDADSSTNGFDSAQAGKLTVQ